MRLIVPCPKCGSRFKSIVALDSHCCGDAVPAAPEIDEVRARMKDCFACAFNHSASAIDQVFRVALLLPTFLMLKLARWLASKEQEIGVVNDIQREVVRELPRGGPAECFQRVI